MFSLLKQFMQEQQSIVDGMSQSLEGKETELKQVQSKCQKGK